MFYDFITKYTDIFCCKNERSFCNAKASHIFSTKFIGIFEILTFEILMSRKLTTSLVLNNWDLVCLKFIFTFHKTLFTGYLVMANFCILNQIMGNKSCTTNTL